MSLLSVDDAVMAVSPHRQEWKLLSPGDKSKLISECLFNLRKFHKEFEIVGLQRRNYYMDNKIEIDVDKIAMYETETALIPLITSTHLAFWLSSLKLSLDHVTATGLFPKPNSITMNSDNSICLNVTPRDYYTWIASGMSTLELHVRNPVNVDDNTMTTIIDQLNRKQILNDNTELPKFEDLQLNAINTNIGGEVVAVLGAGNFDCPVDLLTALFIENNVVVYKFSPLTEPLVIPFKQIFGPLIDRGFLAFTSGGALDGFKLIHHGDVHKWFMTGDFKTANLILYDSPESPFKDRISETVTDQELEEKLKLKKPATIELGNCSPYIVAPGVWTDSELRRHARHLSFGLLMNGGHICARPQIVVTCKNWPQREKFLCYVRESLLASKTLGSFYPGSVDKLEKFKEILSSEGHDLDKISVSDGNVVFADNADGTSRILGEEVFCCLTAEFPLDTPATLSEFLPLAVEFVNSKARGSLAATIIAKTTSQNEISVLNDCVLSLNYGSVGVNISGLLAIYYPQLVWGGSPYLANATNFQSGLGFFGNCYGFRNPFKSVIRSPFVGPNHFLQVLPCGYEIPRFQKLFARLTRGFCNQHLCATTGLLDYMKIGCGFLFNV